jgi:hypothetical protein
MRDEFPLVLLMRVLRELRLTAHVLLSCELSLSSGSVGRTERYETVLERLALLLECRPLGFDLTVKLRVLVVRGGEVGGEGVKAFANGGDFALQVTRESSVCWRKKGEQGKETHILLSERSISRGLVLLVRRRNLTKALALRFGDGLVLSDVLLRPLEFSLDSAKLVTATAPESVLVGKKNGERKEDAPQVRNRNLQLLLRRPCIVSSLSCSRTSPTLVNRKLLLLRLDLKDKVSNALLEVFLRVLGDDELFAGGGEVGRLQCS